MMIKTKSIDDWIAERDGLRIFVRVGTCLPDAGRCHRDLLKELLEK